MKSQRIFHMKSGLIRPPRLQAMPHRHLATFGMKFAYL